jgi:hypothetical protein
MLDDVQQFRVEIGTGEAIAIPGGLAFRRLLKRQ